MTFKGDLASDIDNVFLDTDEFAESMTYFPLSGSSLVIAGLPQEVIVERESNLLGDYTVKRTTILVSKTSAPSVGEYDVFLWGVDYWDVESYSEGVGSYKVNLVRRAIEGVEATLERISYAENDIGEDIASWVSLGAYDSEIKTPHELSGDDFRVTFKVDWHYSLDEIDSKMRVKYGGKVFYVESTSNVGPDKKVYINCSSIGSDCWVGNELRK